MLVKMETGGSGGGGNYASGIETIPLNTDYQISTPFEPKCIICRVASNESTLLSNWLQDVYSSDIDATKQLYQRSDGASSYSNINPTGTGYGFVFKEVNTNGFKVYSTSSSYVYVSWVACG